MSSSKYCIGLDFGTLSCRAVVVDIKDGKVVDTAESEYKHGIISKEDGWALQHPQDYLDAMIEATNKCNNYNVVGIGIDFTASTTLPTTNDGTPLLFLPEFKNNKHAYVKLWKHHGSSAQVKQLNELLKTHPLPRIKHYGGEFNPESSLPRQLAVLQEAPEIYNAMDQWIEAGDWIVWQLTEKLSRGISGAGIKEMYDVTDNTYPEKNFLKAVDPRLENLYDEKHNSPLLEIGAKAGELTNEWAEKLNLKPGIAIASANMDGHASAPIIGMENEGQVMAVIGTSCGWFMLSKDPKHKDIPGILGSVNHAMWPDMNCYEAGQSAVGDIYAWYVDQTDYTHEELTKLASKLKPDENGLVALDWFNGNRSPLGNSDLTATITGLTIHTKPEEIYRALLEAVAFGGRKIVENYKNHGLTPTSMLATGGISLKNKLAMQIYADVLNLPVNIASSKIGPAHGSALFGAVAAGCYNSVRDASVSMKQDFLETYEPIDENVKTYNKLYEKYCQLFDFFGGK